MEFDIASDITIAMAGKTRCTKVMVERICELRRYRQSWRNIALIVGVTEETLSRWRRQGEAATSGIYFELVRGIEVAEQELYEQLVKVVLNDALHGSKEIVKKQVVDEAGRVRVETTEREKPADSGLALKLLERFKPNEFAPVQRLNYDWREVVRSQGVDPQKLEEEITSTFFKKQDAEEIKEIPKAEVSSEEDSD